jgi:peroxiredoxin
VGSGELQAGLGEFEKRKVALVALSVDGADKSGPMAEKLHLTYPVVFDVDLKVIRAFGLEDKGNEIAWPGLYVIARDGRIQWVSLKENYKERPALAEILSALDAAP